jgi:long-chain acyl-CoA synthetase
MLITTAQDKRRRPRVQAGASRDALLEAWEKTLRQNGNRAAILDLRGKVMRTFDQIEKRAAQFARKLEPLAEGDVIAIQIGNHPDWPSLFLACLRKRLVVLPLEQSISDEQRRAVFHTCRVAGAATLSPSSRAKSRDPVEVTLNVLSRDPSTSLRSARDDSVAWPSPQPSLLKLSSGTTADPRLIRFRSEQLLADCENICETMGITARDLNFGVIPISHSYGFSNLLTPLLARGVALALSSDRMPRAILDGIAATDATVFPGMPVFYQSLCELNNSPPLPKLRLCISAGAPLEVRLFENFREKFGRAIHSFYGSSECGGICYAREQNPIPGFVGPAMRGVEIEPLDGPDTPVAGRASVPASRIRVQSRAVGDGYFPDPDETKLGHGIFVPDDLVEKTPAGYRIAGRVSDLINVAGKKVSPAQVEAELFRCEGVSEAIVFARESTRRNEEIVACVVAAGAITEAKLLAHCRSRLSSWQIPRRIFLIDRLPVNERGKISRRELARIYAAGRMQ